MMKSSDMEKVETILNKIKYLKKESEILNRSKEDGIYETHVRINNRFYEIDEDLAQIVLDKFNSELNGYIKELEELGVEYVDETA